MKIKLLTLALFASVALHSQIVLQENFTSPFNPASAGWILQNESAVMNASTTTWFQGDPSFFNAYNGQPADYFAADLFSTDPSSPSTISNWLITPVVTIYNGAVLEFATRTINSGSSNSFPDRLQIRMSQAGTASVIPTGPSSVGTFTDLLLDINPNLNTSTVSTVSNGSVNGYPNVWTVYSVPVTGVTGTVTGRFAFRYYVTNGGFAGSNSDYIGVDAVKYSLPCGPAVMSQTICAGTAATLVALGGNSSTTYSWSTSSTASFVVVNPTVTTVYTLTPSNGTLSCGNAITSTVTIGSSLSVSVTASESTICAGTTVTLSAYGSGTSYSWTTGNTGPIITVTPSVTTSFSVGTANSNFSCFGGNTIMVTVNPVPVITVSVGPMPICLGNSITITASGAATYTYLGSTSNPQTIASPTASGAYFFGLFGSSANGCVAGGQVNFTVNPNPTVTATANKLVECVNKLVTITANGADTYSYSGAASSTMNPLALNTGSVPGTKVVTVVGSNSAGCTSAPVNVVITVSACATTTTGIQQVYGSEGAVAYPNPFTSEIHVSGLAGLVTIYNVLGEAVLSFNGANSQTIDTSSLPKGTYLLRAASAADDTVKLIKLIKN
jgi:hypothetical protein